MPAVVTPKISVVTTAYQAEAFVGRALRSASALRGPWELEIILYDDGSTDGTLAVARDHAAEDPRIRVIEGGRVGRAKALNAAIGAARGHYVAILDADDIALPKRLELTVPPLEADPALVMIAGGAEIFETTPPSTDEPKEDLKVGPEDSRGVLTRISPGMLYASNRIVHSAVLFRRDAWEAAGGYDEDLDICIDYSFYFRLLHQGGIASLDRPTCLRQRRGDSYFAAKTRRSYHDALARIRAEARRSLPVPLWAQLSAAARGARDDLRQFGRALCGLEGVA